MDKIYNQNNLNLNGYSLENSGVCEKDLVQVRIAYQDIRYVVYEAYDEKKQLTDKVKTVK